MVLPICHVVGGEKMLVPHIKVCRSIFVMAGKEPQTPIVHDGSGISGVYRLHNWVISSPKPNK